MRCTGIGFQMAMLFLFLHFSHLFQQTCDKSLMQEPNIALLNIKVTIVFHRSGVYFEKTLKGTHTPLWARNFQLATFGVIIGTVGMYVNDGDRIKEKGILFGYHKLVWLIIAMQAFGGLLVGVVVKYADNILKGFAAAVGIVISCVVSVYLFSFKPTVPFVSGAGLVMLATYLYGMAQKPVHHDQKSVVNGTSKSKAE